MRKCETFSWVSNVGPRPKDRYFVRQASQQASTLSACCFAALISLCIFIFWIVASLIDGTAVVMKCRSYSQAEEEFAALQKSVQGNAPLRKKQVLEAEAARKAAQYEERWGIQEGPFFIKLEPDPAAMRMQKRKLQEQTRFGLEQQIAARLMTTQRETTSRLQKEQVQRVYIRRFACVTTSVKRCMDSLFPLCMHG